MRSVGQGGALLGLFCFVFVFFLVLFDDFENGAVPGDVTDEGRGFAVTSLRGVSFIYLILYLLAVYFYLFLETLAEGRSKVRDAKEEGVLVVGAEFLAGVKTEGVASMLKQVRNMFNLILILIGEMW